MIVVMRSSKMTLLRQMLFVIAPLSIVFFVNRKLFMCFSENVRLRQTRNHSHSNYLLWISIEFHSFFVCFFARFLNVNLFFLFPSLPSSSKIGQEIKSTFISGFHRLKDAQRPKMADIFKKKDSWQARCLPVYYNNLRQRDSCIHGLFALSFGEIIRSDIEEWEGF